MDNLSGIYFLLNYFPIWFTALILWFVADGMIHLMRDRLEGLGYQVSYAAKFGDAGIFGAVLIAATILQRSDVYVFWQIDGTGQMILFAVCVFIGFLTTMMSLKKRSGQVGDIYYDVIIGPMILFFAIMLLPVTWYSGRWYELGATGFFIVVWLWFVYTDFRDDRMNQRQWLVRHGFFIKGEIAKR